jgi:hypothetical protein
VTVKPTRKQLMEFLQSLPDLVSVVHPEDAITKGALELDRFAQELTDRAVGYREMAAWCRLAADMMRGEDVPGSIYPQAGEDPADTTRWQKWRLS